MLTQGCLRELGFSSIGEFIDDFNKKEHNAKKSAWRLKNKDEVNAKERERKQRERALNKDENNAKRQERYDPEKEHLRKAKQYTQDPEKERERRRDRLKLWG